MDPNMTIRDQVENAMPMSRRWSVMVSSSTLLTQVSRIFVRLRVLICFSIFRGLERVEIQVKRAGCPDELKLQFLNNNFQKGFPWTR
jgi:hypothetical protein